MQWSDIERGQVDALKQKEEADLTCVSCKKCGSQWFEQIEVGRFSANHQLILGQEVPLKSGSIQYRFLRCGLCQNVVEPHVQHFARDLSADDYNHCLDTLEGKLDIRKKEEQKAAIDAIQSQEL